jgi:hypothetical protein
MDYLKFLLIGLVIIVITDIIIIKSKSKKIRELTKKYEDMESLSFLLKFFLDGKMSDLENVVDLDHMLLHTYKEHLLNFFENTLHFCINECRTSEAIINIANWDYAISTAKNSGTKLELREMRDLAISRLNSDEMADLVRKAILLKALPTTSQAVLGNSNTVLNICLEVLKGALNLDYFLKLFSENVDELVATQPSDIGILLQAEAIKVKNHFAGIPTVLPSK